VGLGGRRSGRSAIYAPPDFHLRGQKTEEGKKKKEKGKCGRIIWRASPRKGGQRTAVRLFKKVGQRKNPQKAGVAQDRQTNSTRELAIVRFQRGQGFDADRDFEGGNGAKGGGKDQKGKRINLNRVAEKHRKLPDAIIRRRTVVR